MHPGDAGGEEEDGDAGSDTEFGGVEATVIDVSALLFDSWSRSISVSASCAVYPLRADGRDESTKADAAYPVRVTPSMHFPRVVWLPLRRKVLGYRGG